MPFAWRQLFGCTASLATVIAIALVRVLGPVLVLVLAIALAIVIVIVKVTAKAILLSIVIVSVMVIGIAILVVIVLVIVLEIVIVSSRVDDGRVLEVLCQSKPKRQVTKATLAYPPNHKP